MNTTAHALYKAPGPIRLEEVYTGFNPNHVSGLEEMPNNRQDMGQLLTSALSMGQTQLFTYMGTRGMSITRSSSR